jgi:hypothetical protein
MNIHFDELLKLGLVILKLEKAPDNLIPEGHLISILIHFILIKNLVIGHKFILTLDLVKLLSATK